MPPKQQKNQRSRELLAPLHKASAYIRIRPEATSGGHAHNGQAAVAKELRHWDESSVTIDWSGRNKKGSTSRSNGNRNDIYKESLRERSDKSKEGKGRYAYPKAVIAPNASQVETYDTIMPPLLDTLLAPPGQAQDVLLCAYGQTGTGKTHTMLGPDYSLNHIDISVEAGSKSSNEYENIPSKDIHPDWGLFPRAVYNIWSKLEEIGEPFVISVTAAEFYLMSGNDLLANNAPVCNSSTNNSEIIGLERRILHSPNDILPLLHEIRNARHTRSTIMNSSKKNTSSGGNQHRGGRSAGTRKPSKAPTAAHDEESDHQGSSRGHAAIILQILRIVPQTISKSASKSESESELRSSKPKKKYKFLSTTMHIIDLAGAERPDKNGLARVSGLAALMEVLKDPTGETISTDSQTAFINMELSMLGSEILSATECYRKGRPYRTIASLNTDGMRYVGNCLSGKAVVAMVVCLSQAPQCGWETWFSCEFGKNMSNLETMKFYAPVLDLYESTIKAKELLMENEAYMSSRVKSNNPIRKPHIRMQREALIKHQRMQLVAYRELARKCGMLGGDVNLFKDLDLPSTS